MKLLNILKRLFLGAKADERITFVIKCSKCQEIIKVHINPHNDLMNQYKDANDSGPAYVLKKEVLGNNCNNLMQLTVEFDENYNIISESAEGGEMVK
jgi:hypothetical protein